MSRPAPKPLRLWPVSIILGALAVAQAWIWLHPEETRQYRVIPAIAALVLAVLLLLLWFLFLSRARWRSRLLVLSAVLVAVFAATRLVTIRGVTGDLVPILDWRGSNAEPRDGPITGVPAPAASGAPAYPQFLGPARSATVPAVALERDWRRRPPREVWRRPVGAAWSGFAVSGSLAVTQEQHELEEEVVAYDFLSGRELWRHADAGRYETTIGGLGPRATPTIADGRVFTLGAGGLLNALDLASGERLWSRDVLAEHAATSPEWGKSCSPLVVGGLVIVSAGGPGGKSLVAYRASTGELVWTAGDDRSSYSSPLLATLGGREQIVIFNQGSVVGHDPETGSVLWRQAWSAEQPNVAMPVVLPGDRLLVSSGYGVGSRLFQFHPDDASPQVLWESRGLKAKFTNVVHHRGYIYGLDDGILVCLDVRTGERCWKKGRYGHGQGILVGDLLLLVSEKGDVVLLEPVPEEHRELGRFTAFSRKTWNTPALVGRHLLVRNDREAALFELPASG